MVESSSWILYIDCVQLTAEIINVNFICQASTTLYIIVLIMFCDNYEKFFWFIWETNIIFIMLSYVGDCHYKTLAASE